MNNPDTTAMSQNRYVLSLSGNDTYAVSLKGETNHSIQLETPASVSYYDNIHNKPRINGVELNGDLSFADLGFIPLSQDEIDEILAERSEPYVGP